MNRSFLIITFPICCAIVLSGTWMAKGGDIDRGSLSSCSCYAICGKSAPHIPISSLPYFATKPGAYVLTSNLSNVNGSLYIESDNVTVDLNGFTIFTTGDRNAILSDDADQAQIVVKNGTIAGDGTGRGVFIRGSNARVENLSIRNVLYDGISIQGANNLIESCITTECSQAGIRLFESGSIISNCVSSNNGEYGILIYNGDGGLVKHCVTLGNGVENLSASESIIIDCHAP